MNCTTNLRRIMKESEQLQSLGNEYDKMFVIKMVGDNIYNWKAIIYGPEDTFYAGYKFIVDIILPLDYPNSPITVKFITPIQHLNINSTGDICLDTLKTKWTPTCNVTLILISIISLLGDPNPTDPLNSELAELYRTNQNKYVDTIKKACELYAMHPVNF